MFHKEGVGIILSSFITVAILIISMDYFEINSSLTIKIFLIVMLVLILQFFRNPKTAETTNGFSQIVSKKSQNNIFVLMEKSKK